MMKPIILTIACACVSGIGGLALAQQSPNMQPSSPPPSSYQTTPPERATPPDTQSGATTTHAEKRAQMKDCMAQQEQQKSSTGMSKHDMKKYCKNQVKDTTETQPH